MHATPEPQRVNGAADKDRIRAYWNERPPQVWYSRKEPGSRAWFNELAYKRYELYYPYLPSVAEFEHHAGEHVLEVGVGVGTDLTRYARNGAQVSGIDLTQTAIDTTRRHLAAFGFEPDYLEAGDAEDLPFDDASFDLVYSFGVLHHTPNTARALAEIHRVLRPEGKAIVMLYARGWKHWVKRMGLHGVLRGELWRYGYQATVDRNSEVQGDSPLTQVMSESQVRKCFAPFSAVEITRHRLGEYFDYAPYESAKLPAPITRALYAAGVEAWVGENFVIKASRSTPQEPVSLWSTLWRP